VQFITRDLAGAFSGAADLMMPSSTGCAAR
jgi:hypothetical protein